jgi:two-component system, chemotaxis family, chemotaxis protein CheY
MTNTKIRVVLADDEDHTRLLIRTVVGSMDCEVVGEARDGNEAVSLFRQKRPDLLILDMNMPNKRGDDALREVRREFPSALVVMLTSVADVETVKACIGAGAAGYVRKDTPIGRMKIILGNILASAGLRPAE